MLRKAHLLASKLLFALTIDRDIKGGMMNITIRRALLTIPFLTPAAVLWPGDAPKAQGEGALEEVIVTARRREESLMDTPVSISAFTSSDLEARQILNTADIDQQVPNLIYRTNGLQNSNASTIFIRGIGQQDFIPTVQPGVGIYVDGGYVATSVGSLTELVDIESIEVLRGPQGTLFGRNTIGGAILINTVKPHEEFEAEVQAAFGERSRQELRATVNVPFTDRFFGKFSAMHREVEGWVDTPNIEGDDGLGSLDSQAFRAAFRWAGDAVTTDFVVNYSNRETDGVPRVISEILFPYQGQVADWNNVVAPVLGLPQRDLSFVTRPGEYTTQSSEYYPADSDMLHTNLTVEWDITDNLTFKSITTYRDMEDFGGLDGDNTPMPIERYVDITESEQTTQEIQLSGVAADGRLTWLAGYFFFEEETLNLDAVHFPFVGIMSGSFVDNQSTALFGQFTYDFNDDLSLTFGMRSSQERFDSIIDDRFQFVPEVFDPTCTGACTQMFPSTFQIESGFGPGFEEISRTRIDGYRPLPNPPNPMAFNLASNGVTETDKDATEPYINLAYRFSDSWMGYVSYSEGFKGGGFTQRVPPGREIDSFGPENVEVVEVGWKWQGIDGRARFTGAVFNSDYQDMQVSITTLLGGGFSNAGAATIQGFELEGLVQVTDRFLLSGGIGYLDSEYDELAPEVTEFTIDSVLPNNPEYQANISGSYRFPLASGELTARLDYTFNDDIFTTAQNEIITPSYYLVNGSLVYTPNSGNWDFAIQGRNLTDEYAFDTVGLSFTFGRVTSLLRPPQEIIGRFTYRF